MALSFPDIDPVALAIGPLEIRWYALAYLAGFLLGWRYALYMCGLNKGVRPDRNDVDDFLSWGVLGVILGGRIGYILFYQPEILLSAPLDIFKVWQGGMSFHGGVLGVITALIFFSWRRKINVLRLSDLFCAAAPIGLFFGRIANFINGELFGRATDVPWAFVFPRGGEIPRHPSQLYEAVLEGIILFTVLFLLMKRDSIRARPGILTGVFLIGYAAARIAVETVREPDLHIGLFFGFVSMGQILSMPMILLGVAVFLYAFKSVPAQQKAGS